ncbi:MAG: long-chain fatty acid--CoA ligase [Nannocystis sp.]|nr:long-chain fatty acid--CoA ligase [Nannocystis sp.]MBA3549545.1 long-chain fatty acid--CoA ligase [Nannocystis sp.]
MADSIPSRFFVQGRTRPDAPAAHARKDGAWQALSWGAYCDLTRRVARALIALDFVPGQATCILGFNRVEWVTFALGTQAAGGAPAGIYTTCSPGEVQYIVQHAEAAIVLVENAAQFAKLAAERERLPLLRHVVLMAGEAVDDPLALTWEQFLALGDAVPDAAVDERVRGIQEDDTATYIYTSGTTGPPKAVMLSHGALLWTSDTLSRLMAFTSQESMVSYLPLSHIAEQLLSIYGPVTLGFQVYFAEALEKLPDNLKEVQPTIFFGVPRIWEKFHAAVRGKLAQATGVKKRLLEWAMGVARRVHALGNRGESPPPLLALQYALAQRLVFRKLKTALGLGRAKVCTSGAAPIAPEVLEYFTGLDIVVYEVYGQSEDCGPTSINIPGQTRFGAVGKPIPGLEVRLAEDGEILVRGRSLFKGYFKEAAATAETLIDGWLHSGDLGSFDADGFLHITGRKKEIIITAGGKNIAPRNIEAALKNNPLVEEAVVIGDRRKFLGALLTLQGPAVTAWLGERGHQPRDGEPHDNPELLAELGRWVESVNREFARVEHVRKFRVLPRSLTQEDGELTPTLKLKRRIIDKNWSAMIEGMFAGDE